MYRPDGAVGTSALLPSGCPADGNALGDEARGAGLASAGLASALATKDHTTVCGAAFFGAHSDIPGGDHAGDGVPLPAGWLPGDEWEPVDDWWPDEAWFASDPLAAVADEWMDRGPLCAPGEGIADEALGMVGSPAVYADSVEGVAPGADLAFVLSLVDPEKTGDYMLVEVVAAWERLAAWAHLGAAEAAGELSHRASMNPYFGAQAPKQGCVAADELAMRLAWSKPMARRLVRDGQALIGPLAQVGAAVRAGDLDTAKMRVACGRLHDEAWQIAWPLLDVVLPKAATRTPAQFAADIDRALLKVDPRNAAERAKDAIAKRHVCHPKRLADGMAGIWAVLPAHQAVLIDSTLESIARTARAAGHPNTLDQLRADTLVTLATGQALPGTPTSIAHPPTDAAPAAGRRHAAAGTGRGTAPAGQQQPVDAAPAGPLGATAFYAKRHGDDETYWHAAPPAGAPATTPTSTANTDAAPDDVAPATPERAGAPTGKVDTCGVAGCEPATGGTAGGGTAPDAAAPTSGIRLPKVRVDVTVGLSTLMGLDDNPAELAGFGPIPAEQARALAAGGVWRRIVTDPLTGAVLDVGRTRYKPPEPLAEHVRVRDKTCAAPGCSAPARRCDLDHTTEYYGTPANGSTEPGTTCADNLGPLCSRHHRLKTDGGFILVQPEPGSFAWDTPAGLRYRVTPGDHGRAERLTARPKPDHDDDPPPF